MPLKDSFVVVTLGVQQDILELSEVSYKLFRIFHRIQTYEKQYRIKTFQTNILKHLHIKLIENTKSFFIKSQTQKYVGHDPCNTNLEILSLLQYFIKEIRDIQPSSQMRAYFNLLERSYNPSLAPKSTFTYEPLQR